MTRCTCGAGGGIDGHWWTCDLRRPLTISQAHIPLSEQLDRLERLAVEKGLFDAHDWLVRMRS